MGDVILLTGLPGVGKLTIAEALARRIGRDGIEVRVVDNHYVNDVIFQLVPSYSGSPVPSDVWNRINEVREAVFRTVESVSPVDWTFIFTMFIKAGDEYKAKRLRRLAQTRSARFVPIQLQCGLKEIERRIQSPGRGARFKVESADDLRAILRSSALAELPYPSVLESLDVTRLTPHDAAELIYEKLTGAP